MDSIVGTALVIEREMEVALGIQDASADKKRKEDQPSSSWERDRGILSHERPRYRASQGR